MELLSTYHLKRWVEENKALFDPPLKTNRLLVHHEDFIVMAITGPNHRLDFHIDPGDEFFYQIRGDMELHLKPSGERRRVVTIREGEIFVCPGNLPHSPRRFEDTWGLVIERKRRPEEREKFVWFCEGCDAQLLLREVVQGDIAGQVREVYASFNADRGMRTCTSCGYVFPETPMAERLAFLEAKK